MSATQPLSLADLARRARRDVPSALVGNAWWSRLERASVALSVPCHSIFLECHLSEQSGRTDLIARFLAHDGKVGRGPGRLGLEIGGSESFFARWADPEDELHAIQLVDIEWDIGESGGAPFVCPTIEPILDSTVRRLEVARLEDEAQGRPRRARRLAHEILKVLYPGSISTELSVALDRVFELLPAYGSITYVNYLPSRCRARS